MQLMEKAAKEENFSLLHSFPDYLTRGGLTLEESLSIPNHYFAQDGMQLWNISCGYASKLVSLIWPSDTAVQQDAGLQHMYRELVSSMLADVKGLPDFRESKANLAAFVCQVF